MATCCFFILGIFFSASLFAQNDECTTAIALPVGTTCNYSTYSNAGATASTTAPNPACANYAGADVWFTVVVPASGALTIDSKQAGGITDGGMAVYTGACDRLVQLACDDDASPNGGLMPFISLSGQTPGATLFVRFWAYNNSSSGNFSICAKSGASSGSCSTSNAAGCACPTPGSTDCFLLPDILAGKNTLNDSTGYSEYSALVNGVNKSLLRIDVSTPNVGWGPMDVRSTDDYVCGTDTLRNFTPSTNFLCPDGSYPKRLINQRIFHKVGNTFQYELRPAGWMTYHPSHGHIHVDGWGQYTLRLRDGSIADTLQWPIVSSGIKVSFCLVDLSTCSARAGDCRDENGNTMLNNDFPNYGLQGGSGCGDVAQGISVGKVDIYSRFLDESFIRVPYEACNGDYHIVVQIDPDNHFTEINENNNWLEAKVRLTQQRATNTGPYAYIFSSRGNVMCPGDTLELKANGASNYQWSNGATTQSVKITQPGRYWVRATTPCGVATSDTLDIFSSGATSIPAVTAEDTVCTGQRANLYASGNAHWYDAPTGGNLIYVGNNFQTGPLTSNLTLYVADQPSVMADSVGARNTSLTPTGNNTLTKAEYLIFNAFMPFKLKQVTVTAGAAGTNIIELRDLYGHVLASKSVQLVAGTQTVTLDFFVPAGMNHQLGLSTGSPTPSLFSNTTTGTNVGYPFSLSSVARIVGSSLGDKFYPFFYNWQVEVVSQTCNNGARKPLTAVVAPDTAPTITGLDPLYLHTDAPVNLTLNPPGGTLSGPGVSGSSFNPAVAGLGTHQLTYTYQFGSCVRETTITTKVMFDSSTIAYGLNVQLYNNLGSSPRLYVVTDQDSPIELRIFNSLGQVVATYRYAATRGSNMFDVETARLSRGLYILDVRHAATDTRKMFKMIR